MEISEIVPKYLVKAGDRLLLVPGCEWPSGHYCLMVMEGDYNAVVAALAREREAALEEAALAATACEKEDDDSWTAGYNTACGHIANCIRALKTVGVPVS